MSEKEKVILPEKYYLDYFHYMLDFVEKNYAHVLDLPEYDFYQTFRSFSEDAQCLYVRFSNRRGDFFRMKKTSYPEIEDAPAAKEELVQQGFFRINESEDTRQFRLFTKAELVRTFEFLDANQRKEEILAELNEADLAGLYDQEEIVEVQKNQEVAFIKLLFFGNQHSDMTEFVIRDIGNVKIEKLESAHFEPWFESRSEALAVMHLYQLRSLIKEIISSELPLELYLDELPWENWLTHSRSKKLAEEILLKIAYHFEQQSQAENALFYYRLVTGAPSRERQVRILDKMGKTDDASTLAAAIIESPNNPAEITFAMDFLNRSGLRISRSMTKKLKSSPILEISASTNHRVEKAVIEHLKNEGWEGVHSENYIWRGLFGLTFWPILFDTRQGTFHHPLQRQPSDLHDVSFFERRQSALEQQLKKIRTKRQWIQLISDIHEEKHGIANRFVSWHEQQLPTLEVMLEKLPLAGLKKVLLEFSKNTKENSTGFPDLFIWNESDYHFYEVKSPNDHLSAQQLFWIDFLSKAKIKSSVLRISYKDD